MTQIRNWLFQQQSAPEDFPRLIPQFDAFPAVIEELGREFTNKCIYCERKLQARERLPAFFRPLGQALQIPERQGGKPDPQSYFWLLWDWSNLHLACQTCIAFKGSEFPTERERIKIEVSHLERQNALPYYFAELPLLVDPTIETPAPHFEFFETGVVRPYAGSKIGQKTIDIYNLNRAALRDDRAGEAAKFSELWSKAFHASLANDHNQQLSTVLQQIESACSSSEPYAGMKRQLFLRWVDEKQNQQQNVPQIFKNALRKTLWQTCIDKVQRMLYPDGAQLRENAHVSFLIGDDSRLATMNGSEQKILIIHGDVIMGDKVAGDKITGDKVAGDRYVFGAMKGTRVKITGY